MKKSAHHSLCRSLGLLLALIVGCFGLLLAPRASAAPGVATGKSNYEPGTTATITGQGFGKLENVTLQVVHADGTSVNGPAHTSWKVKTDKYGAFSAPWAVCDDDCVCETLKVTVSGDTSGAKGSAVFNDSSPNCDRLQGWFNVAGQWGGTIQGANSSYSDGLTIPLRFTSTLAAGSTHTVLLKYDYDSGGAQRFFDSLGSYNRSVAGVDPTLGEAGAGLPATWTLPSDPGLPPGAQIAGVLTAYNVSSLTFGPYSKVGGVKVLPVTFKVAGASGAQNVIFAYSGHLAREQEWGVNNGASKFPGASRKAFAQLDSDNVVKVSVNPDATAATADLAITMTDAPDPVTIGQNITYSIIVVNNGPNQAANVTVKDTLPNGTTLISETHSQGTRTGTSSLTFALGTLASGGQATIQIVVRVGTSCSGTVTDTATVSGDLSDPKTVNNSVTVTTKVSTADNVLPVIQCPSPIVVSSSPGQCSSNVTFTVTATDNNPGVFVTSTPPSGSSFPVGVTTVNCTATDAAGNKASCSFTVTVKDLELPTISCGGDTTVSTAAGKNYAVVLFTVLASDNCPGVTVSSTPASGSQFPIGTTLVTSTATDAAGNTKSCSFNVTVKDTEAPNITCPANVVVTADAGHCDALVNFSAPVATDNVGVATVVCDPPSGSTFAVGVTPVVCTATDAAGNKSQCTFYVTVKDPHNVAWPLATQLQLIDSPISPGTKIISTEQCLTQAGQSRWFKVKVRPGSRFIVALTGLPANYDLVLYKNIAAAYHTLTSPSDLVRLNAEFAPEAFAPEAFAPEAFAPEAFAPEAFAPEAFAPEAFAPEAFAPEAFAPEAFAPEAFAPEAFAPEAFAPEAFAPEAFAPEAFAPEAFAPEAFAPEAFAGAQMQSVIGVSAFPGTGSEGLIVNTWDNDDDFYIRVRGRNNAFSLDGPFHLGVVMVTGECASVSADLPATTTAASAGGYRTIVLTDLARLPGTDAEKAALQAKLATFAARPEVGGVVVDLGADARVVAANVQADSLLGCPFAKNLVAQAIKDIIKLYQAQNPIQYIVLVGNDAAIPFFRYPDQALLASEKNFVPPVRDATASQAALRLGYVLSQDFYASGCDLSFKSASLPLPSLAIGRLVETATDAAGMLDAYLATDAGVVNTPHSALVTGYDFLADAADAVAEQLHLGLGTTPDALILPNNIPPTSPLAWTANDLRAQLLNGPRHDVVFLASHFSAGSMLASDYATRLLASELVASGADMVNTIFFSAGCHAGYNVVDPDSIPGITLAPDWSQAFARKQATLIAGTGYQYGDTDLIEYSERLYLDFSKQLRAGTGPVAVGQALVAAKQRYLAGTPTMRGIHVKSMLETTLFGLPMLQIDMPGTRLPALNSTTTVGSTTPYATNPGLTLGLRKADVTVTPALTSHQITLTNPADNSEVTATYLSGDDGVVTNPAEPILPLEVRDVSVAGLALRGVGFRGGSYTDLTDILPLTGAPATEIRGIHAPFLTDVFYPMRFWSVNYFDALCQQTEGTTRFMLTPAQFLSTPSGATTGRLRQFNSLDFRLYYSGNTTTYVDGNNVGSTPALSAGPDIVEVLDTNNADNLDIAVRVLGNPAAGIQEVWVTYTAWSGPFAGHWQSLNLVQQTDSSLWKGTLALNGTPLSAVRYMVQAVNGVGLVALNLNHGAYFTPGQLPPGALTPTELTLETPPASGVYSTKSTFSALLKSDGTPLAGQIVTFGLGPQRQQATTDNDGRATVTLQLLGLPQTYTLVAAFNGSAPYGPSGASAPFDITKRASKITLTPVTDYAQGVNETKIVANLQDIGDRNLTEKNLFFIVSGPGGSLAKAIITDFNGKAPLGNVALPAGTYTVTAYFSGDIPLPAPAAPVSLSDDRYLPSSGSATLVIDNSPPVITCPADITVSTEAGLCTATVTYAATATDDQPGVSVVCNPPSGSVFAKGTTAVLCTATDAAGNVSTCSFNVIVNDTEKPTVTCPADINTVAEPGLCTAVVNFSLNASDNCPDVTVASVPKSGSAFPVGLTTVNVTATDASGNTAQCSFNVTVKDTQSPKITCPANIVAGTDAGLCSAVVNFTVTATDNCTGVKVVSVPASGSVFAKGTTTVTSTATDASGNTDVCTFTVTVNDTEKPKITCPANIVVSTDAGLCSAVVNFTVTATDNCPGVQVVSVPASGSVFAKGTTTVTSTATDASGNTDVCTFTVTVNDSEKPKITCPANIVVGTDAGLCSAVVTFVATATDNCPGVKVVSVPASGSTFPKGTTTVTSTATDASGNTDVCTFTVTVNDTEKPKITCPANIVASTAAGQCSAVVNFTVSATDNCPGVSVSSSPASGSTFPKGTTTVTSTATDASGNQSTCTFTVTVNDTEKPAITCPANITVNTAAGKSTAVVSFSVSATDNCPGVNVSSSPASGSSFPKGTTTVTSTATDASGNQSTCTFTVTVKDVESPVITCPANITVNTAAGKSTAVVSFIVTATDNCPGVSVSSSPASGSTFPLGTTTVTSTATDASGNKSTCTFTVTVKDTEKPVISSITASPNTITTSDHRMVPVTLTVAATDNGGPLTYSIVSVTSNQSLDGDDYQITGSLTLKLEAEKSPSNQSRVYTIKLRATDAAGNYAEATTTVTVK